MYIEHLSLSNFRNYARLELGLPTNNPVVLHGQNAQGKTSLLESIYYLATAKSPSEEEECLATNAGQTHCRIKRGVMKSL